MRPAEEFSRCARYGHPTDADGVCDCGAVGPTEIRDREEDEEEA